MKRFLIVFIITVSTFIITVPVQADEVHFAIVSQSFYVNGSANGFTWDEKSTTSISVNHPWGSAIANANMGISTATVNAATGQVDSGFSSSEIIFQGIGASYVIIDASILRSALGDRMIFNLKDQISGETILDFTAGFNDPSDFHSDTVRLYINGNNVRDQYFSDDYNYQTASIKNVLLMLNPEHTYCLLASADERSEGVETTNESIRMVLGVPEPTAMLLLAIGVISLAGVRRFFKTSVV